MADPQTSSSPPSDSLPLSMINPDDMSYFAQPKSLLTTPPTQTASLPQPTPSPTPQQPAPSPAPPPTPPVVQPQQPAQPAPAPAVAPPTPLTPRPATPPPAVPPVPPPPAQPAAAPASRVIPYTGGELSHYGASVMQQVGPDALGPGYKIQITSTDRPGARVAGTGGVSQHALGDAFDFQIIGPDGRPIPNEGWQSRELYKRAVLAMRASVPPELQARMGWGGNFPDEATGQPDLMHVDFGGDRGRYGSLSAEASASGGGRRTTLGPQAYDIISKSEGTYGPNGIDWNRIGNGGNPDTTAQLETMTIAQVAQTPGLDFGGLQITKANLLTYAQKIGVDPNTAIFNRDTQMRMADAIYADQGLGAWVGLKTHPELMAQALALTGEVPMEIPNAGNMPGYQRWMAANEDAQRLGQAEIADMQKRMADMEAGSPEQRALADQLLRKQIQLMDRYETMIAHPPTQKPHDMIGNFGSIATLIGIFAGRFAHRPMVASLNAAGAAMQAMNDNDNEAYKNAFNTWKTQADMTSNLMTMESNTYKGIMEDKRLDMDEKFKMMTAQAQIYQNAILMKQAEAGNYEKMWEYTQKYEKTVDDHKLAVAQLTEANQKAEAGSALTAAVQADDQKWITDNPDAYQAWIKDHPERAGSVPPEVHFDNQTRRQAQEKTAARAGTAEAVQVTWPDGNTEILYGQRGAPGHFVTDGGRDVDLSTAKSVLPMTKSQAGQSAMALPDYQGPAQWEGMPTKPPPGIDKSVWSMALDWVRTGKQPQGMGRLDQLTHAKLQQAYPVAQEALGIKPEDEYAQSIKYAAEKARMESIERSFGSGIQGRNLVSLNTVADHISLFRQYAEALRNHDTQRINQLENRLATEAGSPEVINFALAGTITGDEVVRLLTTTGGTVTDRDDIHQKLASYDSPEQLEGAANTLTNFVRSRYGPLRQQYARGDAEREQYFDQNMVTPEARQLFTGPPAPISGSTPPPAVPAAPGAPGATTAAPAPGTAPPRPPQVPTGSQYSPSRNQWRDSTGKLYDAQGNPL